MRRALINVLPAACLAVGSDLAPAQDNRSGSTHEPPTAVATGPEPPDRVLH